MKALYMRVSQTNYMQKHLFILNQYGKHKVNHNTINAANNITKSIYLSLNILHTYV